jgi:hypothetical protein
MGSEDEGCPLASFQFLLVGGIAFARIAARQLNNLLSPCNDRPFHSLLPINPQFREEDVWDEDAIYRRSGRLLEKALAIWALPSSSAPSQ